MPEPRCRICRCTNSDCRRCVERTGFPCSWLSSVELKEYLDLSYREGPVCSACGELVLKLFENREHLRGALEWRPA